MEQVVENAKFTMGYSGNPVERLTNTVKFSVAVNGIVPIMLFGAVVATTILFVFMMVFYKGKPAHNARPLEKRKANTVQLSVDMSTQGSVEESSDDKESPSTFWSIVGIVCFIFPPFLLLAAPFYLAARLSKKAGQNNEIDYDSADPGTSSNLTSIHDVPLENKAGNDLDVPWWIIDK